MSTTQVRPITLPAITGLRAIAALLVFLCHARGLSIFGDPGPQGLYDTVFDNIGVGTLAVTGFFVLSGFVLTWSTRPGLPARQFYRRRFMKMFPNHAVVFGLILVLAAITGKAVAAGPAVANLLLVNSWIPDFSLSYAFGAVNGPTWSLSSEWALCLLFPVLFLLVRRIQPDRLWRWAIGVSVATPLLPWLSHTFLPADPPYPYLPGLSTADMWTLYFSPLGWASAFVVGMLLARIVQTGRWIGLRVLPVTALLGVVFAVAQTLPVSDRMTVLYPLPVSMLFAALAVRDLHGRPSWLGSRPMVWFGNISYAFFLVHLTTLYTLYELFSSTTVHKGVPSTGLGWGPLGGLAFLVGTALLCVLISWPLHKFVEVPIGRRFSRAREKVQVPIA